MPGVRWWGTISAVAAPVLLMMTLTFLLVGACYIATSLALKPARTRGQLILIGGAIAGMLVAAFPEYPGGFGSVPHFVFATIGFAGLTFWPAAAVQRGPAVPWGLRAAPAAAAIAVQFALLAWFGAELVLGAHQVGLAERVMGAAQATWPLVVVLSCGPPFRSPVTNQTSTA